MSAEGKLSFWKLRFVFDEGLWLTRMLPKKHGSPSRGELTFPKSGHSTVAQYKSSYGDGLIEAQDSNNRSGRRGAGDRFTVGDFEASWKRIMVYEIIKESLMEKDLEYMCGDLEALTIDILLG